MRKEEEGRRRQGGREGRWEKIMDIEYQGC